MEKRSLTPLGLLVKAALKEKKMTQVELAEKLGTSKQYLDLILHGERAGSKYLNSIAEICSLDLENVSTISCDAC